MADQGTVELRLLGRFVVLRHGVEIPAASFGGRKVRTLVKVLASRQGRFVGNDVLAEAIWPERLPADPAANLQVLVNRARRALGDSSLILTGQGGYALASSPACRVDAEVFLDAVTGSGVAASPLVALGLWHGDPLPEELYDGWAADYRTMLLRHHQRVVEESAAAALAQGDVGLAVDLAAGAVEAEPLREVAVLTLMEALAASGDPAAALRTYDHHRRALAEELGVDPSPDAQALHLRLVQQPARVSFPAPRPSQRAFAELPFVGRSAELARVLTALDPEAGRGVLVTVTGPSGAGKSRFLDQVGRRTALVRARAYAAERSEPWTLLRTVLQELVALDLAHVDRLPAPMGSALAWLVPEVDAPPGAPEPGPESRRPLLREATIRLLDVTGVVLAVDDLQWCDPSSLGVLRAVLERGNHVRTLLAFRPDEVAEGDELSGFLGDVDATLPLDVLHVQLLALAEEDLHGLVEDPEVVAALSAHTDRTPMAVAEVLRSLAAAGMVTPAPDGRWRAGSGQVAERVAVLGQEGQRRAIRVRAGAQGAEDREVLALLALTGREVDLGSLVSASGTAQDAVLTSLARLQRRGLVRLGERGWATAHDMVTEVIASSIEQGERARLHAAVARALDAAGEPTLVAHHLRESGDLRGAVDAFVRAAQQALAASADREAAQLADSGVELAPAGLPRAELLEVRGTARRRLGDLAGAKQDLRAALGARTEGPKRARILAELAMLASGSDDLVRAARLADLALVAAGDDAPARARALEVASVLGMNLGQDDQAASRASEALVLFERLADSQGMARVLDARAMARFLGGDVRGGEAALRRAADLFEDSGDLVRVVTPRSTGGHAQVFAGRAEQGLTDVTSALGLARALGHPEGQCYALWHRAEALAELGRCEEATAEAAEALAIARAIGHRGWTATGWRAVGLAAQGSGDLGEALHAFECSLAASEHLGLFASWAASRAAVVLVRLGLPDRARPLVARALREGPPLAGYEARWAQVELAAATGDPSARAYARSALTQADAGGVRQCRDRLVELAGLRVQGG